jgi:hypothetical protein
MKKLLLIIIVGAGCAATGRFDGDVYVPPGDVSNFYNMPDISTVIGIVRGDVVFGLGVELLDIKQITSDIIFFEHKIGLGVAYRWTSIIEIKTGLMIYYDFDDDKTLPGIELAISN